MPNPGRHEPQAPSPTLNIGNVGLLDSAEAEINPAINTLYGQTLVFARIDSDLSGGTAVELVAGTSAKFIYVIEYAITVDTQCELEFAEGGVPTTLAPPLYFAQRGGIYMPRTPGYRFKTTTLAEGLDIDEVAGVSVKIRGGLWYYKDA